MNGLVYDKGEFMALWVKERRLHRCSACSYMHREAQGRLPDVCPGCQAKIKAARGSLKLVAEAFLRDLKKE